MSAESSVAKAPLPRSPQRRRRGRTQVHAFIADDLYKRLKANTGRRGLADAAVIEEAIKQHLDQSTDAALTTSAFTLPVTASTPQGVGLPALTR